MTDLEFTGEQMVYFARYCLGKDYLIKYAIAKADKEEVPLQSLHSALIEWKKYECEKYIVPSKGMQVAIGTLIDRLSVVNIRIWMAEDIKRKIGASDKEIADATRITNVANTERNKLIQAIDEALGQESFKQGDLKMYGK